MLEILVPKLLPEESQKHSHQSDPVQPIVDPSDLGQLNVPQSCPNLIFRLKVVQLPK